MYKVKLASIYSITHTSGYFYLGMSIDTYSRWSSHYTQLKDKSHSSIEFTKLFNNTSINEWSWTILEYVSITEYKNTHKLKGKVLETSFRRYLLSREKYWMNNHSINLALNKDKKHFR